MVTSTRGSEIVRGGNWLELEQWKTELGLGKEGQTKWCKVTLAKLMWRSMSKLTRLTCAQSDSDA